MKIDPSKNKKINIPFKGKSSPSAGEIKNSSMSAFGSIVNEQINNAFAEDYNRELEHTVYDLDAIVDEIKKNPLKEDALIKYKNRLGRFLAKAISMFQDKQIDITGSRWKKNSRILVTVNIINENLAQMTSEILKNEQQRIELLAKFDMLKGLILNMKIG